MSAIVTFLYGEGIDAAGRSIEDVLGLSDAELEHRHDFIQWLFPLPEPSSAMPSSPVLTNADIQAVISSPAARANLAKAAERMLSFYERTSRWRRPSDHNHLRITRIIKSLRLLQSEQAADDFYRQIIKLVDGCAAPVSATSRRYWAAA